MSVIEAPAPTVTAPVTRREVLHRAADLLEEFGWCQGQYARDHYGRVTNDLYEAQSFCVAGALARSLLDLGEPRDEDSDPREAGMSFLWSMIERFSDGERQGAEWNDAPDRTKAEVVARLREAAETV